MQVSKRVVSLIYQKRKIMKSNKDQKNADTKKKLKAKKIWKLENGIWCVEQSTGFITKHKTEEQANKAFENDYSKI